MKPDIYLFLEEICEQLSAGETITSIANNLGVSRELIHRRLKLAGINHQRLKFNHDYFSEICDEHRAYWLGFLMADGCVSLTQYPKVYVHLSSVDKEHLKKFHCDLKSCIKILEEKNGMIASSHFSNKMCEDLVRLGCTSRKSSTLEFPDISRELIHHLIRGYIDGDGCYYFNKKTNNIKIQVVGTNSFLTSMQKHLGTNTKLNDRGGCYVWCAHGNKQVEKIIKYLYKDATIFLERKKEKIERWL